MLMMMTVMKKRIRIIASFIFACCLAGCSRDDVTPDLPSAETITVNVDVVLPATVQAQWQDAIDWALDNLAKAQQKQKQVVRLNLRYHDEDTEDLDRLGYELTHPEDGVDSCHAIIGPYHSSNANDLLQYAYQTRLPVVMPTCTSAELQRTNARNTYAWFLTESDITQCEIMLSAAQAFKASDVALIYTDDLYGRSFLDWFAYYATERGINVADPGVYAYKHGDDLNPFLNELARGAQGDYIMVLVALSDAADYKAVCDQVVSFVDDGTGAKWGVSMRTICADTSLDDNVLNAPDFYSFNIGVTPYGSMNCGFPQAYRGRFMESPYNGSAQIYDALTIIALGAAYRAASPGSCIVDGREVAYDEEPYGPGLTDYMRAVVSSESGTSVQWDPASLSNAFQALAAGHPIDMSGATGNLFFDSDTHTKILNTTYMIWQLEQEYYESIDEVVGEVVPVLFLSTAGTSSEASTTEFWKLSKKWHQNFSHDAVNHNLPDVTDRWAVIVSPSTTWSNYRHQADAFAMYQTLKYYGYDDDHIVLIVEDNLANDSRNIFPGEIYVERGSGQNSAIVNDDVRKDAVVDYHFSDLQPDDLADILMGHESERLPQVIHPVETSNVFFFWSGHGGNREGPLWGNEDAGLFFGTKRIKDIVARMNDADQYRRMFFAIETCYSGKWGQTLTGQPDVLVLTAASPNETSKADAYDTGLGIYLSNAFTRTFRQDIIENSAVTIYELYRELARTTTGSHVTIYNNNQYGSVYEETLSEYLPQKRQK